MEKTTVYCNDPDGLVIRVLEKMNYANSVRDTIFKLCIDGYAGFLKLCLRIISCQTQDENFIEPVKSYNDHNTVRV